MEGTGKSIAVAYVLDEKVHQQRNAECINYWPAYVEEILSHRMVKGEKLEPEDLENEDNLSRFSAIIVADGTFSPKAIDNLHDWVEGGGILIGSACKGLDDLFGFLREQTDALQDPGETKGGADEGDDELRTGQIDRFGSGC